MKEQIHTVPVNEGFDANDECPFCYMERAAERSAIRFVAGPGASYMEPDVRAATARTGFCTSHIKNLYDYGNRLGTALMLQTHMTSLLDEMKSAAGNQKVPEKQGLFKKKVPFEDMPYHQILKDRTTSCFICDKVDYNMDRYYYTFFYLLKDEAFRNKVLSCKGFCLRHFAALLETAEAYLPANLAEWFYPNMYRLTLEHFERVKEELDFFISKFDYRNADKPWGNSQDALPRAMQKLQGFYPTDPVYKDE